MGGKDMKRITALILSLMMSSAGSVQITYSQSEHDECQREGGCIVVTHAALQQIAQRGYRAGQATCETRL